VQFLALDVWNGNPAQAQSFVNNTGITYPLLRQASAVGASYQTGWDITFVVSPDGIITLKDTTGFDSADVRAEIDRLLADLATSADAAPTPALRLGPPTPNPFNPRTTLTFTVEGTGSTAMRVDVWDARGRRVARVWEGRRERGVLQRVEWDGTNDAGKPLGSGVYHVRVEADGQVQSRRATLVK